MYCGSITRLSAYANEFDCCSDILRRSQLLCDTRRVELPKKPWFVMIITIMRNVLGEQIVGKHLPLVMAHRGGFAHGKENSSTAVRESLKNYPDIVEIDVNKTSDQVLFCYHGSNAWELFLLVVVRFLPFRIVAHLITGVETLEDILSTIQTSNNQVIVYLDIKSTSISAGDLSNVLGKGNLVSVWIAAYTFRHLDRLRRGLGEEYVYIFNRAAVFFRNALRKSSKIADVLQLFRHQWTKENINLARGLGLEVSLFSGFLKTRERFKLAAKYRSLWFPYRDTSSIMFYFSEES